VTGVHVDDLIDGYVLGALDPAETHAAQRHLARCKPCRRLLARSGEVIAVLPDALAELTPRPTVRRALLAAVQVDVAASAIERPRRLLPFRMDAKSSNPILRWASLGMAAAFIVGLVGGVTGWALVFGDRLQEDLPNARNDRDTLETVIRSRRLLTLQSAYAGRDVRALVAVPDAGQPLLIVSGLPPPPAGQAYRLWLYAAGVPVPAGVLRPDGGGNVTLALPVDFTAYDRLRIDLQPASAAAPAGVTVIDSALR